MSADECKYNLSDKKDQSTQLPSQSILHVFCQKTFFCASYYTQLLNLWTQVTGQFHKFITIFFISVASYLMTFLPLPCQQPFSIHKTRQITSTAATRIFIRMSHFFHNVDHRNKLLLSLLQNKKEKKYFLSKNCIQIKFM